MKKFVMAWVLAYLLAMGAATANAANLPAKAAAPAAHLYDWTGPYVGGEVGALWSSGDTHWDPLPVGPGPGGFNINPVTQSLEDTRAVGGVHLGYNYMFMPNWVAGIEADWSWTGNNASETTAWTFFGTSTVFNDSFTTMSRKIEWLSTIRGRLGYTVLPQALVYATGGFAFGHIKYDATASDVVGYRATASQSATKSGYAFGGGLEWALTKNWLLRGEYLFYRLGSESTVVVSNEPGFPSGFSWGSINIHTARVGLSYKFGN